MAISRDIDRQIKENVAFPYVNSNIFRRRGVHQITQYVTATLKYPTSEEIGELELNKEVWTTGTKYFNLAHKYYGDPEYWWVIAYFNLKPLETDFMPGDIVTIPTPLPSVLRYMGYS